MSQNKLIGKRGAPLNGQSREIISNVMFFMKTEANNGALSIPIEKFRERVLAATGISLSTYRRIKKVSEEVESGASTSFNPPARSGPHKKPVVDSLIPQEMDKLRRIIHNFPVSEKRFPTLNCILQKMKDCNFEFTGSITSLRRILINMGFKWQKMENNKSVLMEGYDVRMKRITYLKNLMHYREQGRPIIYCDETYLHSTHVQSKGWTDGANTLKCPMSKGRRLIILHAGGNDGFIKNGLLIFTSGKKTGDYHDDMNWNNFSKWVQQQLIPNLPPRAVLVVDNAAYHNVQSEKSITTATRKAEMVDWLIKHGVTYEPTMLKPELYALIKYHKPPPIYKLDQMLEESGHKVLRLPPYHPELNPIEKIWASVKNWVSSHNITFKLEDVEKLAREKFDQITAEEWANLVDNAAKYEDSYIQREHLMDTYSDTLRFNVNTGSSDEWGSDVELSDE